MARHLTLFSLSCVLLSCYGDPTSITGEPSEENFAGFVIEYKPSPGQFVHNLKTEISALSAPDGNCITLGGFGGSITLKMNNPIIDKPGKPDFVVWGNAMFISGNSRHRWAEPAIIEISPDNTHWYLIGGSLFNSNNQPASNILVHTYSNTNNASWPPSLSHISNYTVTNICLNNAFLPRVRSSDNSYTNGPAETTETLYGYADCTPKATLSKNWIADDPFQFGIENSGGDAIMLEWAIDTNGQSIYASISNKQFYYIRLTTAVFHFAGWLGEMSTEVDAVGICR